MTDMKLNPVSFMIVLLHIEASLGASVMRASYKAAVYSLSVKTYSTTTHVQTRQEALAEMNRVLEEYNKQASLAHEQGAQIIVFPEAGLYLGDVKTRSDIYQFSEEIPNPKNVSWNPCKDPERFNNTEVLHSLSCIASDHSIYLVANMLDSERCLSSITSTCPDKNQHIYNTNVAFSPSGQLLAKYHKTHLFYEPLLDPGDGEVAYFDTEFGRIGLLVCFDILGMKPTVEMVNKYGVTDIAFSAAWLDIFPYFTSIGFHSSVARGLGVNILASNLQNVSRFAFGSGIYTPEGPYDYYYDWSTDDGKLVISTIDTINKMNLDVHRADVNDSKITVTSVSSGNKDTFKARVFDDLFTLKQLKGTSGKLKVCQKNVCCSLTFKRRHSNTSNSQELFAFGAFDGFHTYIKEGYFQVCILLKCATDGNIKSCGQTVVHSSTEFTSFIMSGVFQTKFVYPQIILSNGRGGLELPLRNTWDFNQSTITVKPGDLHLPLTSTTLFARDYSRSGGHKSPSSASRIGSDKINAFIYAAAVNIIIFSQLVMKSSFF